MGISCLLDRRNLRRFIALAGLALVTALAGCGESGAPAPTVAPNLSTCDITTSPCQRGIYLSLAEMLDASGILMPSIRTISVDQHADEVRSGLDVTDLTGEDPESRGLRLLGFIPEASESLVATQTDYWITRVAAYYQRGSNRITVIDRDYEQGTAKVLLAHELIHAIQHGQFNLGTVGAGVDTEDGTIGVRSIIEGDAVFSSYAWYYEVTGNEIVDIDWDEFVGERTASLRDRVADEESALIDSASSFPYSYGFGFFANTFLAEGLPGRTDAFRAPPTTTLEVMRGYGMGAPVVRFPDAAHPAPVDGAEPAFEDRVGAWYVYGSLVRQGLSDEDAWALALGWVGDELAIYDDGEEVVAVWRVRFAEESDANLLSDQVNALAGETGRSALTFGEDAYVFAAESSEALVAWAAQPLDEMTASIVPKSRAMGGPISVGTCLQTHDFTVPRRPPRVSLVQDGARVDQDAQR